VAGAGPLHVVAAVLWFVALAFVRIERRLVRRLRSKGATHPGGATEISTRSPLVRARLWRLRQAQALVETAPGHFYLDATAYAGYRRSRRRRGLVVLLIVLPIVLLLVYFQS
jgi:hypothetical protein